MQFTKLLLSACFLVVTGMNLLAQQTYSTNDSARIFRLLEDADSFAGKSLFDSAFLYTDRAFHESLRLKMLRGQAYTNLKIADFLYRKGETTELRKYDSVALRIGMFLKDTMLIAISTYQLGQYYLDQKELDKAENLFKKALEIYFEQSQDDYTGVIYNDMGYLYGERGIYDQQIDWYLKAVRVHRNNKNNIGLAQSLSNLSATYYDLNNMKEAIALAKEALELRDKTGDLSGMALSCNNISQMYLASDSLQIAIAYQERGLKYALQSGISSRIAQSYVSMSLLYNRQKKFKEAFESEKKAIEIYKNLDQGLLSNRYIAAAFYSNILGDSSGAVEYFRLSEALAKSIGNKIVLRNVYKYLSDFYQSRKDMAAAYDYYKKHILYKDSLLNIETNAKIASLQAIYENERKDFEINRLSTQQRIKQLEIEKQKAIIAGNKAEALQKQNEIDLLSQSQLLQDEQLKRQGDELEKQILLAKNNQQQLMLSESEKMLQQRQLSSQKVLRNILLAGLILFLLLGYLYFTRYQLKKKLEQQQVMLDMRNNISENLHDDIGASLSNINILTELARRNLNNAPKSNEYLDKAGEDIQRISESLSDIVWNINPKYDDLGKLLIRMKRYAADMMDGKQIDYEMNFDDAAGEVSFSMEQRRHLYLIFKEGVNNLVKYSNATKAIIKLEVVNKHFLLTITDNGNGFDTGLASSGNGLSNMKKRAMDLKANLAIESTPGSGTSLKLDMPIT
jgi:signal transduction histidine kinase